ncbi:MAG: tRNA (guanine-N1)-methyltransferase [Leptolyngbyaceae cyanobacterium bins.59]|nr:tRNA (guanine-N1)-methyltransferase [Leptolyngbyaceae cyanobacterium bins.59]
MQTEGQATFAIGNSFYNPQSQVIRDLGVLAATVYQQTTGHLRVLDAMAGSGVRSLRYCLESQADRLWINDSNPEIGPILRQNLKALPADRYHLTHWDANRVFFDCYNRQDFYDLVDVDCFGSAAPYLSTSLWAVAIGGVLYITSTNGRVLTGHAPVSSLRAYGAYARSHPAANEQALRLLLGSLQQLAAAKGLGIEPVFSLFAGQTYRVMVRLVGKPILTPENYGFLGYCHTCGQYQTVSWDRLGKSGCPPHGRDANACVSKGDHAMVFTGPLWLGPLHDRPFLHQMMSLAHQRHWSQRVKLLSILELEADLPPYFYTLRELGKRGQCDIPPRSHLIQTLQSWGYRATPTHIHPQAIKTDADLATCICAATGRNP